MKVYFSNRTFPFIFLLVLSGFISNCKKPEIPFQGPRNPGFEEANSDSEAAEWETDYIGGVNHTRTTGAGFLPSQGLYFENFIIYGNNSRQISQNNVDFTRSKNMTFDYSFTCDTSHAIDSFCVDFLFTSNGTVNFWHQAINYKNTLPIQILNKTIPLPATADPGRLIIQIQMKTHSMSVVSGKFLIDNIRVK